MTSCINNNIIDDKNNDNNKYDDKNNCNNNAQKKSGTNCNDDDNYNENDINRMNKTAICKTTIKPANIIKNDVDVNEDSNNHNDGNKIITM